MHWQTKCVLDNCKGLIPFQSTLLRLKRRVVAYRPADSRAAFALDEGLEQVRWLRQGLGTLTGKTILEIGSGWELLLPHLFSLGGAARVYLTDQTALLDEMTLSEGLANFRLHRERIIETLGIEPAEFDRETSQPVESVKGYMERHRFVYLAPCDCRQLSLESGTLDAVTSRSVLEHIPPPVLKDILRESFRLLRPGGVGCHFVDNSDHWEHLDRSISRVNFLRYSDRTFALTHLNSLNYQNRLRHSEYEEMLRDCGFEMVHQYHVVDPGAVEALKTLPLAPRFQKFPVEDLATVDSYFLARKPLS
jgi:SAM-dependent methyltransferase